MEGRRVRSEATWDAARAAYLGGLGAHEVCARFDVGLSALRRRARIEGWRRSDQDDPDPDLAEPELEAELEALGAPDFEAMADRAARLAQRALARGELGVAEGWMRLHARLDGPAFTARQRREHAERTARSAAGDTVEDDAPPTAGPAPDVHSVHSVHPVLECAREEDDAGPEPLATGPQRRLNRAERRRRARLATYKARVADRGASAQGP